MNGQDGVYMPYLEIWIHMVWATKAREPLLTPIVLERLQPHIQEQCAMKEIYLDIVNGYVDHMHALFALPGTQPVAKIAQLIKGESSHWLNQQEWCRGSFEWQDDYAAFSVCPSDRRVVREYIRSQASHHRVKSFAEEYGEMVERAGLLRG